MGVCLEVLVVGALCTWVLATRRASVNKFFWGLKPELRSKIAMVPRSTIMEVIDLAITQEMVFAYDCGESYFATQEFQSSQ